MYIYTFIYIHIYFDIIYYDMTCAGNLPHWCSPCFPHSSSAASSTWWPALVSSRFPALTRPSLSFPALGCHQELRTSNKTKKETCWALFESYCKSLKILDKTNRKWVGVDCIGLMASHQVLEAAENLWEHLVSIIHTDCWHLVGSIP